MGTPSPKYTAEFKQQAVGLGANVAVLKDAANGDDAIIVVSSVITRDVPANALLQESRERRIGSCSRDTEGALLEGTCVGDIATEHSDV